MDRQQFNQMLNDFGYTIKTFNQPNIKTLKRKDAVHNEEELAKIMFDCNITTKSTKQ